MTNLCIFAFMAEQNVKFDMISLYTIKTWHLFERAMSIRSVGF